MTICAGATSPRPVLRIEPSPGLSLIKLLLTPGDLGSESVHVQGDLFCVSSNFTPEITNQRPQKKFTPGRPFLVQI